MDSKRNATERFCGDRKDGVVMNERVGPPENEQGKSLVELAGNLQRRH